MPFDVSLNQKNIMRIENKMYKLL